MEALTRQEDNAGKSYRAFIGPDKSDLDMVAIRKLSITYCLHMSHQSKQMIKE